MVETTTDTIRFNATNAFSDKIGEMGLDDSDIRGLADAAAKVHGDIVGSRKVGELGFCSLHEERVGFGDCLELSGRLSENVKNLVVLGIGGSALGTIAMQRALNPLFHNLLPGDKRPGPRLFVCDNVDPTGIGELMEALDPAETAINVISKSGSTAETLAQFLVFYRWLADSIGETKAAKRVIATTDPEKGFLRKLTNERGFASLPVPASVGGRFSAFSPVGLFPLAVAGVDVKSLLDGAQHMDSFASLPEIMENPAYLFGAIHVLYARRGRNVNVMMPYSDKLRDVADWFRQLWAESLGKKVNLKGELVNTGMTPVKALGTTDQHSQVQLYMEGPHDKVVTFLEVDNPKRRVHIPLEFGDDKAVDYLQGKTMNELLHYEKRATEAALTLNGRPNLSFNLPSVTPFTVGQLIYLFEMATVFAGGLLEINPLDQPGVELGKQLTFGLMGREGFEERADEVHTAEATISKYLFPDN